MIFFESQLNVQGDGWGLSTLAGQGCYISQHCMTYRISIQLRLPRSHCLPGFSMSIGLTPLLNFGALSMNSFPASGSLHCRFHLLQHS